MRFMSLIFVIVASVVYCQEIPSKESQIAAAVMAAPHQFRDGATVLGYDAKGTLTSLRHGSNNMICLADDPNKKGFSVASYHMDLEPFMARGRQLRSEGKSFEEVFNIRETEAKNGKLKMPEKGATLHVLYGPNGKYKPQTDEVINATYRYVVYIPWATTETTGLPIVPSTAGGPWIMDPGTHRAHIMINPPAENIKEDN